MRVTSFRGIPKKKLLQQFFLGKETWQTLRNQPNAKSAISRPNTF
jgi:hypothetical protein